MITEIISCLVCIQEVVRDALLQGCLPLAQAFLLQRNTSHDRKTKRVQVQDTNIYHVFYVFLCGLDCGVNLVMIKDCNSAIVFFL